MTEYDLAYYRGIAKGREELMEELKANGLHVTCWGEPVVGQKIPRESAAGTFLFIPDPQETNTADRVQIVRSAIDEYLDKKNPHKPIEEGK